MKNVIPYLNEQDKKLLLCVAEGNTDTEIAKALGLHRSTVSKHVCILIRRFQARDRTNLVHEAHLRGVL